MEDIKLSDLKRIMLGEAPLEFLLEVLIRTIIIYFFLLIILRLMGKRMTGQLTISEMAVMITLGAIVSAPMQMPDRGIVQGIVILVCALAFQRGLNLLGIRSSKAERIIQGKESLLIKDGVLQIEEMEKTKVSQQQLYAFLRNAEIYNLGKVERAYLEACGLISIFTFDEDKPGLPVYPPTDEQIRPLANNKENLPLVCSHCGNIKKSQEADCNCENCNSNDWIKAIK